MPVDTDGFCCQCDAVFFIVVSISAVSLKYHVRLARTVELIFHYVRSFIKIFLRVCTFCEDAFVEGIGHSVYTFDLIVNFYCICSLGLIYVYKLRQRLVVYFDLIRGCTGISLGVRTDYSDTFAPLAYLIAFFDHDPAFPSIRRNRWASYLASDPVGTLVGFDIFVGHDLVDSGHLLCFRSVDLVDLRMANTFQCKWICKEELFREFQPVVIAKIPKSGGLVDRAGTRIF